MTKDLNEEPKYHSVAARAMANALSFFLKENEGIVAQGENEDGQMQKLAIWAAEGKIRFQVVKDPSVKTGCLFWMHDDQAEAVTQAALNGENVFEI